MTTITGTEGSDFLSGTSASDTIFGGSGNDVIFGDGGDDIIHDGVGFDVLLGGSGNDLFRVVDNNRFDGPFSFNPVIDGGEGIDTVDATNATGGIVFASSIFTTASIERVIGSSFADSVDGKNVNFDLFLSGGGGNDTLIAGAGNDILIGGEGSDFLEGGAGADRLTGNNLPTFSNPPRYDERPTRQPKNDVFFLGDFSHSLLTGFDIITDLEIGIDSIDAPFAVSAANLSQLGNVGRLSEQAIASALNNQTFAPRGAATFTYQDRTFLAMNDTVAAYQAATDAVVEITGYRGNLSALSII